MAIRAKVFAVSLGSFCLAVSLLAAAAPAIAQGLSALQSGDQPLAINADEGIEWRRDSNQYIARGNASAAQGDVEIFADVLIATYRDAPEGGTEIYQIDAQGSVRIVSPTETVYGDAGRYDVDRGVLVMRGQNLKLETGQDVVTARDSLEFWEKQNIAVARGDAVAIRDDKRLQADTLTALFKPDESGKLRIEQIDGKGNVEITTPTDFVRGNKAVYYVQRELATLTGAVKITRGDNQLNGEYAEVNLAPGVSRLLAGPPGQGGKVRVRGLLIPRRKPDKAGSGS